MSEKSVLIVDDERNIRATMIRVLETAGYHVESAVTGEEALLMMSASPFDLVFLDLKLPAMDGLEVLRRAKKTQPEIRVVVVTAHGTVEAAVEAMKLGAADFMQKPFTPQEVRDLAAGVLHPARDDAGGTSYEEHLDEARRLIRAHQLDAANIEIRAAVGQDPARPEAFNLLGAAAHLSGHRYKAQDCFRAALALDATYAPARRNLERSVSGGMRGLHMELDLAGEPVEGR